MIGFSLRKYLIMVNSPQFLKEIFDSIGIGICVTDKEGRYLSVNQQYCQIYGYTQEELIGQKFTLIMDPEKREEALAVYCKLIEDDHYRYPFKWPRIRKDGTSFYVSVSGYNTVLENGEKVRTSLVRDISQVIKRQDQVAFQASILKNVKDGVVVTDLDGKVLYWNEGATEIFGRTQEEMIGQDIRKFNPDFDGNVYLRHFHSGHTTFDNPEGHFIRRDGTAKWINARITPLYDDFNNIIGFIGVSKDITERIEIKKEREKLLAESQMLNEELRTSEEELRQNLEQTIELNEFIQKSEKKFKSLLEKSFDAIVVYDEQGYITYASPSSQHILGYAPEELIGTKGRAFVLTHDLTQNDLLVQEFFKKPGERIYFENRTRHKDGKTIWVEVIMTNLLHDESVRGVVSNFRDITERKRAEQEISNYAQRLHLATQAAEIGIWDWHIKENQLDWDAQMRQLYGTPKAGRMGYQDWKNALHPEDQEAQEAMLQQIIQKKQLYDVEFRILLPSGETRWIKAYAKTLYDEQGKPMRMIGVNWDITWLKKTEDSLRHNNETLIKINDELDHFVYSTSHNLRAPLTSMLGIISLMKSVVAPEEYISYLYLIEKSIRKLDETIQEITDYSKNTRVEIKREKIAFAPLIHSIIESLSFLEGAEKMEICQNISPDLHFTSDSNRLKMIFNNLLSNAFKYYNPYRDKPRIDITVEKVNTSIAIRIKDNGIGIDQPHLDKIFDMFFRASEKAGSGLGLYIVKEAVHKLGGTITVHSVLGEGTEFVVQLPDLAEKTPDFYLLA